MGFMSFENKIIIYYFYGLIPGVVLGILISRIL